MSTCSNQALNLEKRSEQYTHSFEYIVRCGVFVLCVSKPPIDAFHLICQHYSSIWHSNFEGITLYFVSHRTCEQKTSFRIVRRWRKNKSGSVPGLLMPNCGVEVYPNHFASFRHPLC